MRATLPWETIEVSVYWATQCGKGFDSHHVNWANSICWSALEDLTDFLDNAVVSNVFEKVHHSDWNYGCLSGKCAKSLESGKLELLVWILDKIWEKWDETFHVDWFDSNLLVEAVYA